MVRSINPLLLAVAFLAMRGMRLPAQQLESYQLPSRGVESFTYRSATMGRRYVISVGLPSGYETKLDKRYPALIATDGNLSFRIANAAARSLQGDIEDLVVIGVGPPYDEADSALMRRRIHEFSPPNWAMTDTFGLEVAKVCQAFHLDRGQCIGGAPRFLDFIVSELLPRLAAKYRIDVEQLGLFGISAGGFFASWAIFQQKSPFRKYIISSPAMAYGDGEI